MWPYPKVVAHRGAGTLAPENTLAAMQCAAALGFKGVEFDVMLSQDAVPVLMHDPELGRTVPGTGKVCEHSAAQLRSMDAGAWLAPRFAGEPVPSLQEIGAFCIASDLWMNVEIKPAPGFEAATGEAVVQCLQRMFGDLPGQASVPGERQGTFPPLVSSFSIDALLAARRTAPAIARALLADHLPPDWQARCKEVGASALHLNQQHMTPEIARLIRQTGYGLFCYTVNEPDRATLLMQWGVDAFCTDRLDLIGPGFGSEG